MAVEPPRVRPTGIGTRRPFVLSVGSLENCQVKAGSNRTLMNPAGMWRNGCQSLGPASSTQTVVLPSSLSRLARIEPAAPAPTTTKSNVSAGSPLILLMMPFSLRSLRVDARWPAIDRLFAGQVPDGFRVGILAFSEEPDRDPGHGGHDEGTDQQGQHVADDG